LPSHTEVTVAFGLYIINTWDGGITGGATAGIDGRSQPLYTDFATGG
jgi:hypothetical protein